MKHLGFIILISSVGKVSGVNELDPCQSYRSMSDPTMKSDEIIRFGDSPSTGSQLTGWTRYTATMTGSLMTACPTSTECGVNYQYWMSDNPLSEEEGITNVTVCGRSGGICCDTFEDLRVKNCSDFVVYDLKAIQKGVRYCFAADPLPTTTSTSVPSRRTDDESADYVNVTMIAAIVGSVLGVAIVVIIVGVIVRKKLAKRYSIYY